MSVSRAARLLRNNGNFRSLWLAGGVSHLGTRITSIAIPLLALNLLHASVFEVSLLTTVQTTASLLLTLPVGAWADRVRKRPVMIAADIGRAAVLVTVPLLWFTGALGMVQLSSVVFLVGAMTVVFDVTARSYLPALVPSEHLAEGNARLQINESVAASAGPTLGGWLVQLVSAPIAIVADVLSYLWSAIWLGSIRQHETRPDRAGRKPLFGEIGDGLAFLFGNPVIRYVAIFDAVVFFFQSGFNSINTAFLVRAVGLTAGIIGTIHGLGMLGAIAASFLAPRLTARLGTPRALALAGTAMGLGAIIIPLTGAGWRLGYYVFGSALLGFAIIVFVVVEASYCQTVCPPRMLGRMVASLEFIMTGAAPVGSLAAAFLTRSVGLRPAVWIVTAGMLSAAPFAWMAAARARREQPGAAACE